MTVKMPTLEQYLERAEGPDIIKNVSPDGKYVKFKYTEHAIYNLIWDEITLNARGHVFRLSDGECVLRPWSKFFNYGELFMESGLPTQLHGMLSRIPGFEPIANLNDPRTATDKLDGSLCIAGIVDGALLCTTSGAFTAWQGSWAQAWLITNKVQLQMLPGYTYLFEIIANDDLHPIKYDFEGCVLLGIIDNATGEEQPYAELQAFAARCGIRVTEMVALQGFEETVKYVESLPATKEGLVVTYPSGFKMKIKGPEFLAAQKLFHSLSEKNLLESFEPAIGDFPDDVKLLVPEEFKELKDFMVYYAMQFRMALAHVKEFAGKAKKEGWEGQRLYDMAMKEFAMDMVPVAVPLRVARSSDGEVSAQCLDELHRKLAKAHLELKHTSAEVASSMPPGSAGLAQVAPLKRKPEAHRL